MLTIITLMLLVIPTSLAQTIPSDEDIAGTLPSSRAMWAMDRALDFFQHRGDRLAIAKERLAESRVEVMRGDAESADRARAKLDAMPAQRGMLHDQVRELEDRYNAKFDFNLDDIKTKVNTYLENNNLFINDNVTVNVIGNRRMSFKIITELGKIKEIKKLDIEMSSDAIVTLSHGRIFSALHSEIVFDGLVREVAKQVGVEKGRQLVRGKL